MPAVIDPVTGLELYELSHRWGMYVDGSYTAG